MTTTRNLCPRCLAGLTSTDIRAGFCTQCHEPITSNKLEAKGMSESERVKSLEVFAKEPYQHRIVKVRRVGDATGAYCLDCQRVIADVTQWQWSWRKSQVMHEQGSGHRTIMYKVV